MFSDQKRAHLCDLKEVSPQSVPKLCPVSERMLIGWPNPPASPLTGRDCHRLQPETFLLALILPPDAALKQQRHAGIAAP